MYTFKTFALSSFFVKSQDCNHKAGVPQGNVLGRLLFTVLKGHTRPISSNVSHISKCKTYLCDTKNQTIKYVFELS